MSCGLKVADVPLDHRESYARGVHLGCDIARANTKSAPEYKSEAYALLYHGLDTPLTSEDFWMYHGSLRGIATTTGSCPNCGSGCICKGPHR